MTTFEFNIDTEYKNYNLVKDCLIAAIARDKYLTEEQANEILEKYQIAIVKKKWWQRFFSKVNSSDMDSFYIRIVKVD